MSAGRIRPLQAQDVPAVLRLWLDTNCAAHSFIPKEYWAAQYALVGELLPQAEVYVYENAAVAQIDGFIGLTDDYIEGLFVRADAQRQGIGRQLLCCAKERRAALHLSVYQKNTRAVAFYRRERFVLEAEGRDEATGEAELRMGWRREPAAREGKETAAL